MQNGYAPAFVRIFPRISDLSFRAHLSSFRFHFQLVHSIWILHSSAISLSKWNEKRKGNATCKSYFITGIRTHIDMIWTDNDCQYIGADLAVSVFVLSFVEWIWVPHGTIPVTGNHVPIYGGSIRRYDSTKILVQTQAFTRCSRSSGLTFLLSYLTVVAVATFIFIKNSFSWAWAWRKCICKATREIKKNTQRKQQTQRENMRQRCS